MSTPPLLLTSWTFTVRKNAVDTAVTCTISGSDTYCTDTTNSAAFSATDLLSLSVVPSGVPVGAAVGWVANFN